MQDIDLIEKSGTLQNKNLLSNIKMGKEILTFADTEVEKITFTVIRLLSYALRPFFKICRY